MHGHTAAEVIYSRVDHDKPLVGMTNFKGNYITREDVRIAKNYLSEEELRQLNLLVAQYLDYAELQALDQQPMTMRQWVDELDRQIVFLRRKLLEGAGKISHAQAIEKAEREFDIYRAEEMRRLESDFDKAVKRIAKHEDD